MAESPRTTRTRSWPHWLLVLPLLGVLIPPVYDVRHPEIGGVPFFYWWQLLWVPISMAVTVLVSRMTDPRPEGDR
ncbi:uncharacterized protein DUF3311 [Motilibacter rhizosphaerae]|uniref:Uncharacterized protein DUF3311 n=1 Tax=Motilibacter rhizosphaerae TaxID=598652 RepID=A0A4Q7NX32_9ACTN|nr:DUF3311 domain-containing protein [Motilibacter rhizosphaerae]RZS90962.1 uncharacterized protein DUF3311 [Motilibacter rhizosphaerae]